MNDDQQMNSAINVDSLTVAYGSKVVLDKVSWIVNQCTLAAVIGPNGGGKSTLLKTLLGMVHPNRGEVTLFGKSPIWARRKIAYLPQAEEVDWLFPITSLEVVLQGRLVHLKWFQKTSKDDGLFARSCLEQVGMSHVANQPVGELSGGQRQRVFIARALAQQARLIVMDEPATGLDAAAQHDLLDLFWSLKSQGHTIVITTHDLNCLAEHFDSVLGLNGHVVVSGVPSKVLDADILTKLFARHFPIMKPTGEVSFHDR